MIRQEKDNNKDRDYKDVRELKLNKELGSWPVNLLKLRSLHTNDKLRGAIRMKEN